MSHAFILYLGSLMWRTFGVGLLGFLGALFLKSVAQRHALWCAVLAAMLLMPLLAGILPPSFIAVPIPSIAVFERPAGYSYSSGSAAQPTGVLSSVYQTSKTRTDLDLWTIGATLYACVSALLLFRFAWAYRSILNLKASSREISLPLANELGTPTAFAIYESEAVNVPLAGGFSSPYILLPASWKTWDEWKLRAVLSHEFTHIRRCDPLIQMIAAINTAIYWLNPLSWCVEGILASLAEKASDEAAILRNGDPTRYAQVLLQFARSAQKRGRMRLTSVAMAKHRIHSRIETVLGLRSPQNGILTKAGWITTCIVALPIVYAASVLQVAPAVERGRTPQSPSERLRFEAATIKPTDPAGRGFIGGGCHGTDSPPSSGFFPIEPVALGRCRFGNMTLKMLIQQAYGLRGDRGDPSPPDADDMVMGGPGWVSSDRYDIEAKAESPTTVENMMLMVRTLLEDRFKLNFHSGSKDLSGFALLVAKSGPKLTPARGDEEKPGISGAFRGTDMVGRNAPIKSLARVLSGQLGKQVADETGLSGAYNFTLTFAPVEGQGFAAMFARLPPEVQAQIPGRTDPNGPSIFTAVQEQLGLRLEARKVPSETIVIDAAQRPADN